MLAEELLIDEIPILNLDDSVGQALEWMDEFKVSHLPVTNNKQFFGLVSEEELLNAESSKEPLLSLQSNFVMAFVFSQQHVFEALKRISENKLTVIPILDAKNQYLGAVSTNFLMEVISDMPVVKQPGGIIVLEMSLNDYSLFEIARIVEENGAKILGSFITRFPESTKMELTLKINREDITQILNSLERFDYNITASYNKGLRGEDLADRYNQLIKYMNI